MILNFSHPLTDEQLKELNVSKEFELTIKTQLDLQKGFVEQISNLLGEIPDLSQRVNEPFLLVPPALSPAACVVLAAISAVKGQLPHILRLKPKPDSAIVQYQIGEVIDLQEVYSQFKQI